MPIEFAPPAPNLQPFNITPPQYTDPLQTLAQMGQLRTQGLQQKTAQMGLQQQQMQLDSNKAMLKALVDAGTQGTPDEIYQRIVQKATQSGQVLPEHLITLGEHHVKMRQDAATLDKTTRENTATDIDRYRGLLAGVQSQDDLAKANERAVQIGIGNNVPRFGQYSDPTHLQAFSNSLATQAQVLAEAEKRAAAKREEAQTKLAGVQTTEAEQKIAQAERQAAIAEIQAATDPNTGVPNPADWSTIQSAHPKVKLPPGRPTPELVQAFIRSGVPAEKQPEYDINAMKAKLGLMGDAKFDQYQLRYAQSIGKKPIDLTFKEMQKVTQQYATDTQNPEMLTLLAGLKGAQTTVAKAQAESILTPEQIKNNAADLLTGNLAPDQIKDLRAGRINQGAQIIEAARAMAKEQGKEFSLFDLEQQSALRENTLKEFTNTTIGHAGGQKLALNTLIHHADLYLEAAQALKNGNFRPGNAVYNKIATMFGSAPPTNAALLAQFFASETGKVATGGVPAEGEIKSILSKMSTDGSPDAMEGAGRTLISIAAGRMTPLKELRDKAKLEKYVDILGPDARDVLQRRGYNPETMKPWKVGDTVTYQGQPRKVKAVNPTTGKLTLE